MIHSGGCCGRPFVIGGSARQSAVVGRTDWLRGGNCQTDDAPLNAAARAALASAWVSDALMEHPSIASFARFTLELLASGAPAHLVLGAQRAGLDEVANAKACFALASRFAGQGLGPTELATGDLEL